MDRTLFEKVCLELERYWQQTRAQADLGVLSFPPGRVEDVGHLIFSSLSSGGVCTLPVTGHRAWDPRSHYYEAARFAARRGRDIERIFLVPNGLCRKDTSLIEHLALDESAGIKTSVLNIGDLLSTLQLPSFGSLDFGLWDDQMLCLAIGGTTGQWTGLSEWRVTRRDEDMDLARSIIAILRSKAPKLIIGQSSDLAPTLDLEEPLVTTAPISDFLSTFMCRGSYLSREDCSWYHSVWQYLRVFNMVSTPTWHSEFYRNALGELAATGHDRVLISGTADYSTLAHVIWAYRIDHARTLKVTVLDLCETPLFLCRWYAKLTSTPIDTVVADIFAYQPANAFDLIVTDAFLTRFLPEERRSVVTKWSQLLRKGGKVVTTIRIDPNYPTDVLKASPQQADAFRRRALREAKRWHDFLSKDPEEVATKAQRYAERMTSCPVREEQEIRQLFSEASLEVEECKLAVVPGEMVGTMYAEVRAEKM